MGVRKKYTDEDVLQVAKKYEYLKDFRREQPTLFNISFNRGIDISFLKKTKRRKKKFTDDEIMKVAKKYEYLNDFRTKNKNFYLLAYTRKLDISFLKNAPSRKLNKDGYRNIGAIVKQEIHSDMFQIAKKKGITLSEAVTEALGKYIVDNDTK
ncbi:hypothetical protein [Flammeovirga sp. SJP92]|uniref:hypothetical protein n=1 Tax=Flammeovirga sp. SJP92 TaxID=1775430 RepID=UPI000787514E|nr:hypothetical protein [Flammeovirga sp. SJP92]KXX72748.1 hypothetical protein AVL50_32120 [Flammeovirga sp. SJP92]